VSKHPVQIHRAARILAAAVVMLAAVCGFAARAAAVDNGTLGIRPATESDFFHLSLYPGSATDATAVVSNHTASAVTLQTYPVDGASTPQGRFSLASQRDPRRGDQTSVHLDSDHIAVPAFADVKVPFRLTVPVGTPPGDYAGGLIIQSPERAGKTVTVGGQTAVQLNVIQRQGVRIYLHVAGTAIRTLQTGALTWHHTRGTIAFDLTLKNTGNTTLHPTASLDLRSRLGANTQLQFEAPEMLLPGASLVLHTTLAHAPLVETGHADATVQSEAGTSHTQTTITYAPATLIAAAVLLLAALLLGAWRVTRFLRRARRALTALTDDTPTRGRHAADTYATTPHGDERATAEAPATGFTQE
jgi:hypothetical protein